MNETKEKKKNRENKNKVLEGCQFVVFITHFSAAAQS